MEMNHHMMAKATTDAILTKFKTGKWMCCNNMGIGLYRVGCDAAFPSPDAAFVDADSHALLCFEFKPPTETKRGILTGVGQSIAYLQNCDLSFLIAPQMLEDFYLGDYLKKLYKTQLSDKVPVGLILYDNNNPSNVDFAVNVNTIGEIKNIPNANISRFWAKHQDLPIELFHLLLHCYYLRKTHIIEEDAFEYCWNHYLVFPDVADTQRIREVVDCKGNPIYTLGRRKKISFLDKKLADYDNLTPDERKEKLAHDIDVNYVGDNYYNSIRKNYLTFLKHLGVIDSAYDMTDLGYALYNIGINNGPDSKLFKDYFTKALLLDGHHLDLIIDLDACRSRNQTLAFAKVLKLMNKDYEERGMIKRNPGRQINESSNVGFLKYELILWKALDLIDRVYHINWKHITEICLLPNI